MSSISSLFRPPRRVSIWFYSARFGVQQRKIWFRNFPQTIPLYTDNFPAYIFTGIATGPNAFRFQIIMPIAMILWKSPKSNLLRHQDFSSWAPSRVPARHTFKDMTKIVHYGTSLLSFRQSGYSFVQFNLDEKKTWLISYL